MKQNEKLNNRDKILDEYENQLGLPENKPPGHTSELEQYLTMDRKEIEALVPSTAISISYRLSQFSFYFQRCINREMARVKWADSELRYIASQEMLKVDQYATNKLELVCHNNSAANSLRQIKTFAEQRVSRLSEISSSIRNLSYTISLIIKSKTGGQ